MGIIKNLFNRKNKKPKWKKMEEKDWHNWLQIKIGEILNMRGIQEYKGDKSFIFNTSYIIKGKKYKYLIVFNYVGHGGEDIQVFKKKRK